MVEMVKEILVKPILLADQVAKAAGDASSFKSDCAELKHRAEQLAALLRTAAGSGSDLCERPTCRIVTEIENTLELAFTLVSKCHANSLMMRLFTIIPPAAFKLVSSELENSIGDVTWLLAVSDKEHNENVGVPPIAANEPILCMIWDQIATLSTGSVEAKSKAAASLVSLSGNDKSYSKMFVEEGGVVPLLKLLKEGKVEAQENAARAIGHLGRDPESVRHMIRTGLCLVFAKILKEGSMKVQSVVAWAISEFVASDKKCQDHFTHNNIIRLLVKHLAFETIQEHSKYAVKSSNDEEERHLESKRKEEDDNDNDDNDNDPYHHNCSPSGSEIRGRESEDTAIKTAMKAMAAKALWQLSRGNSAICRTLTESRTLLCFAALLEKGAEDVQYNLAMALMEIAAVVEKDSDLRSSTFKPNSPAAKAVVDQLMRIVEKADSNLLIPCVRALGCLARTFRANETNIIGPLVRLLDNREEEAIQAAAIALTKFACTDNYLHVDHSKAIVDAGGVKHLVHLVYRGQQVLQIVSLILLSYIVLNVPDSNALAHGEVLAVLEWASKQRYMAQVPSIKSLLPEAKGRLELYQSIGYLNDSLNPVYDFLISE